MNTYHEFMNLQQKYLTKQAMLEQEYLSVLKQTGYPVSPEELGSILIQRLITKMENEELPAGKSAVPINRATIEGCEVSKDLASSVLTKKIMKQLGDRIEYNGAGSFIICDGKMTCRKTSACPGSSSTTSTKRGVRLKLLPG